MSWLDAIPYKKDRNNGQDSHQGCKCKSILERKNKALLLYETGDELQRGGMSGIQACPLRDKERLQAWEQLTERRADRDLFSKMGVMHFALCLYERCQDCNAQ